MPIFKVQAPDGSIIKVEAADQATAIRGAREHYASRQSAGSPRNLSELITGHRADDTPGYRKAMAAKTANVAHTPGAGPLGAFTNGLMFGFNDEIEGAGDAVNTWIGNHTGNPAPYSPGEAYRAGRDAVRAKGASYAQAHPVANTALTIAGAVATPGVAGGAARYIARGAGLGAKAVRSARVGALVGGAAGLGNAEGDQRLAGAVRGAELGGVTGGLIPVGGAGLGAGRRVIVGGAKRLTAAGAETVSAARRAAGATSPARALTPQQQQVAADQARRFVSGVMVGAKKTTTDLASHPAEAMGKPVTGAEALGRSGMYHLGTMGKRAGATADPLEGALIQRRVDTPNRILGDITDSLGVHPEAARGNMEAIVEQGQAKAKPLFDAARASPEPVTHPDILSLTQRPVIKKAISAVAEDELNAGRDPAALGIVKRVEKVPGGGTRDVYDQIKAPTAQTLDAVKKAVGRQVERSPITGKPLPDSASQGNFGVTQASKALTAAMREHIPGYAEALDTSGDYLSAQGAFDRVKGALLNTRMPHADFAKMWGGFSESEQAAGQAAIANDLHQLAQNGRLKPQLFSSPAVKAKLETAFGADRAADFTARTEQEAGLLKGYRMQPGVNSTTAETELADGDQQSGRTLARAAGNILTGNGHGLMDTLGTAAVNAITVPLRGARTPLSEAARDEVGRLLLMKPSELAAELDTWAAAAPKTPARAVTPYAVAPVTRSVGLFSSHQPDDQGLIGQ